MAWYWFVLGVLVTWRLTHLLHTEDGPWRMVHTLRTVASRHTMLRELFACFYCLSMWVAVPVAYLVGESWRERLLLLPALSAAAILLERVTSAPPMPAFVEDAGLTPPQE
ncbi:MAG: hypothetical protein WKG01_10055 [Kofleriaceae bacterium]